MGLSVFPPPTAGGVPSGLPDTPVSSVLVATGVTAGTNGSYGSWVELLSAAANTASRHVTALTAVGGAGADVLSMPVLARIGIGSAFGTVVWSEPWAGTVETGGRWAWRLPMEVWPTISAGQRIGVSLSHANTNVTTYTVRLSTTLLAAVA